MITSKTLDVKGMGRLVNEKGGVFFKWQGTQSK